MSKDDKTKAVDANPANTTNQEVSNILDGLESGTTTPVTTGPKTAIDYSDRNWLETNEATFPVELTSKKFDANREPKVQSGLNAIKVLMPEAINPLILLLGKWWECKPARSSIKDMIDAEAAKFNIPPDRYLQIELRKNVDMLSTIQQAVDRLRYSITYFKPRAGVSTKEIFKIMTIDGVMYNVSLTELESARLMFGDDKVGLKAHLVGISTLVPIEEVL